MAKTKVKKATGTANKSASKKVRASEKAMAEAAKLRKAEKVVENTQNEFGRGRKGPRPTGTTLGLGIGATWVHVFEQNAKASKAKRQTDAQIAEFMAKEFPGRKTTTFSIAGVKHERGYYNRGTHWHMTGVPNVLSVAYDESGEPIVGREKAAGTAKPKAKKGTAKPKAKKAVKRSKAEVKAAIAAKTQ
jgi:hypothetical protein